MVASKKIVSVATVIAVALSFLLYALSFEPYGTAESAYIFAIPAILACKILFVENKLYQNLRFKIKNTENPKAKELFKNGLKQFAPINKVYFISVFVFSYLAWVGLLIWLRHVYPPTGWLIAILFPIVISSLFFFSWFALLPIMLPSSSEDALSRLIKYAAIASLWVILEWIRSWLLTGFPWLLLANTQWTRVAVIQSASWGGVWFVSFTLIFFNLATAEYLYKLYAWHRGRFSKENTKFSKMTPEFYVALLLVLSGVWTYIVNLPRLENETKLFRAGLVQTDFAGILKWSNELASENLKTIKTLTLGLNKANVDVVLLPEAATPPKYPINYMLMKNWLENLAKTAKTPILTGNITYDAKTDTAQNGAFFISETNGVSSDFYAKKHLVPFGEYVPKMFSFLGKVVPVGNMKSGESDAPFAVKINGSKYKMGAMICYEDVFPNLARTMAANDSDMFFVCTNDSWYGREAGAWQHASHSALQAVATRKIILRSSNNGLSTVFDQYGRMLPCFTLMNNKGNAWNGSNGEPETPIDIKNELGKPLDPKTLSPKRSTPMLDENGSIYFRGCAFVDVISYKNFENTQSFYVRHGNWFVWVSAVLLIIGVAKMRFEKKSLK